VQVTEPPSTDRLREIGVRLEEAKRRVQRDQDPRQVAGSALAQGFRLSLELVSGVLVGAGLGFLLDRWLGTKPWGMIILFLLGTVAGFVNLMRAVGREAEAVKREMEPPEGPGGG
jgi:ATP synthase protein I